MFNSALLGVLSFLNNIGKASLLDGDGLLKIATTRILPLSVQLQLFDVR